MASRGRPGSEVNEQPDIEPMIVQLPSDIITVRRGKGLYFFLPASVFLS
jgi:hypothetical protein